MDSVHWAEEDARGNLASQLLGVNIKDMAVISNDDFDEVTLQKVTGVLSDIRIVALWVDGGGSCSECGTSYAMACLRSASPVGVGMRGVPDWLFNLPKDRTCAIGACGPTIVPETQEQNVVCEAQERLASQLCVGVEAARVDGVPGPQSASVENVPDWATQKAAGATVSEKWLDEDGIGPLQEPGVLYALVCL